MNPKFTAKRGPNREIIIEPSEMDPEYSLIWMHGLGDSADGFFPIFASPETFTPDNWKVRLLTAPDAPVTINMGMRCNSWYDILSLDRTESSLNWDDVLENSKSIQKVIDEEVDSYGGDPSKVFIGGFSQGCAMALHNGLTYDKGLLGGIIGFSGYLFPQTAIPETIPPVHISHGEDDPMINIDYAVESYKRDNFIKRVAFHR